MIKFEARQDCNYLYDYAAIFSAMEGLDEETQRLTYRQLILDDLFFVVLFVMEIEKANHPFVVDRCHDVQFGPKTDTLDVWARGHFKSCVITQAETIQYHLRNPEHCTGILGAVRPLAKTFLRSIKLTFETSNLLKWCFPDIVWQNPQAESPKWSEDDGLILKRRSSSRKESTVEAWGLVEGQPTGRHFERLIFDDIETDDIKESPDMLDKVFSKFEMAGNLSTMSETDIKRVIGTYYSNYGPIVRIENMCHVDTGKPLYTLRKIPATDDGTAEGRPVFMPQSVFDKEKGKTTFPSQQLCNPTPVSDVKLNPGYLKPVEPGDVPKDVIKFMVVDQAGGADTNKRGGDLWAAGLFGVKPHIDDVGASDVYILALEADRMSHSEGIETIVRMYMDGGVVRQVGIEKVGLATTEIHVLNALKAHGRKISIEGKTLKLLTPANRPLAKRIEGAVQWPLMNGKLHYSTAISEKVIARMKVEMEKFPFFHSDILNIIAYLYDMLIDFPFSAAHRHKKFDRSKVFYR